MRISKLIEMLDECRKAYGDVHVYVDVGIEEPDYRVVNEYWLDIDSLILEVNREEE